MINELTTVVRVGIADLKVVKAPDRIRTSGLGSCVGVVIYDPGKKTAGLAHVMLPDSSLAKQSDLNEAKYADTAIDLLVTKLTHKNNKTTDLKAKITGGAEMFQFSSSHESLRIGPRNTVAVKEKLMEYGIRIIAEDVGGNSGRTIEFDPETGNLHIRTVHKGETII